jgi:hypothetical protein
MRFIFAGELNSKVGEEKYGFSRLEGLPKMELEFEEIMNDEA